MLTLSGSMAVAIPPEYPVYGNSESSEYAITAVRLEDGTKVISFRGSFVEGISDSLRAALEANPDATRIIFNSPGGVASEALPVAALIDEYELQTVVGYGSACVSACAEAFLAGHDYIISGVLAFHRSYIPFPHSMTVTGDEGFGQGQFLGSQFSLYRLLNGFHPLLSSIIYASTGPSEFLVFTHEDSLNSFYTRGDEPDSISQLLSDIEPVIVIMDSEELRQSLVWKHKREPSREEAQDYEVYGIWLQAKPPFAWPAYPGGR